MMGMPVLDACQLLVNELQVPMSAKEFNDELYRECTKKFPDAKLRPGN